MSAGHIAILFAGIINVGVGIYLNTQDGSNGTVFIAIGAAFVAVAAALSSANKKKPDNPSEDNGGGDT